MLVLQIGLRRDALYVDQFKLWHKALQNLSRNALSFCGDKWLIRNALFEIVKKNSEKKTLSCCVVGR